MISSCFEKVVITTNYWKAPNPKNVMNYFLEGDISQQEQRDIIKDAEIARACWKPPVEAYTLLDQLQSYVNHNVQVDCWHYEMLMFPNESPFPITGKCTKVSVEESGDVLQAFLYLKDIIITPTKDGFDSSGYLENMGCEVQRVNVATVYQICKLPS